jgi:phage gpG-like protein
MAGLSYSIDFNGKTNANFLDFLQVLQLKPPVYRKLQNEIGQELRDQVLLRFVDEVSPDGTPWEPSQRALKEGGQTLTDSTRLRTSFDYLIDANEIEIGTNVEYASFQQIVESGNRPVREFLGIGAADEENLLDVISTFISELQ